MRCKAGMLGANRRKGWNASTLASTGRNFDPNSKLNRSGTQIPGDVFITPDGSAVLVAMNDDYIDKFSTTIPWNIGGGNVTHEQSFSVASQETQLKGVFFKPDGLKMYICGFSGDDVTEYALSVPWDLSTASHATQKSLATINPLAVRLSPDGLNMYVLHQLAGTGAGLEQGRAAQYALSSAWEVSTATHVHDFNFPTTPNGFLQPAGFDISPSGYSMFYGANFSGLLYEYELTDPWNISTASLLRNSSYIDNFGGVCFGKEGTSCYISDTSALYVQEFISP